MTDPVQAAIEEARLRAGAVASTPPLPPAPPAAPSVFVPPAGWTAHPTPGYYYQGQEVLTEEQLKARYVAPAAPPLPPVAPAAYVPPVAPTPYTPPAVTPAGGAVAGYDANMYKPGRKLSMADMNSGRSTLNVENFLKVDENGIKVSFLRDDPKSVTLGNKIGQKLQLKVDFATDIRLCFALRYQDPISKEVFYARTADRVVADDGTPWGTCLAKAANIDKTSKGDYPSVDISGKLTAPFVSLDGTEVLPIGTVVGFSTAVMNFKAFSRYMTELLQSGAISATSVGDDTVYEGQVYLELGHKPMLNKNNQHYGIFTFTHVGVVDDLDDAAPTAPSVPSAPVAVESPSAAPAAPATVAEKPKRARKSTDAAEVTNSAPPAPPAPPAPAVFPPEGWTIHPTPGYFYKGDEVLTEAQLRAKVA